MTDKDKQQPDQPEADRPELDDPLNTVAEVDAAVDANAEAAAAASDTFEQAGDDNAEAGLEVSEIAEEESGDETAPEPEPQLERLQKILAKSGIASRRHAEELITSGRVQVNGKVVTELGSKADSARDHIRVDGKLLQGSERHRYFMLNKPKGYVTTVSDPEGRPTIMEFFSKTRERLYPVGRLDYLSEGLLLVTNDGELANKLTRAASNVEKTYLVKVSGQPSEEDLDRLRQGVPIAKGKPGSSRVHTAPAEIRPFRPGKTRGQRGSAASAENPWYEVVLIEGRNRELRKMFEEIGHHVEKIRRVGYGPLVLDLEPGKTRELEPEEVENLRKAAEGKYRKPKSREPKTREPRNREFTSRSDRPASRPRWEDRRAEGGKPRGDFGSREERRPFRGDRPDFTRRSAPGGQGRPERSQFRGDSRRDSGSGEPRREFRPGSGRPNPRSTEDRPQRSPRRDDTARPSFRGRPENRNRFEAERRGQRPQREEGPKRFGSRPSRQESGTGRSDGQRFERPRRFEDRPQRGTTGSRPFGGARSGSYRGPQEDRPRFDRSPSRDRGQDRTPPRERPERDARPRLDIQPVDDRSSRPRDENRPPRRERPVERESRPRFDRPRRDDRGGPRGEGRSESRSGRPERRPDSARGQRPSTPRSGANFRPGKPGASSGKQGTGRSSSGRRPGYRPNGKRPNKRP
ncbi:pseudouridine synthase [Occallatibacter savannae]|uniref:pseudouridine synthase n=1 Tax=Occallatibacter savannae TaxID=1002691 RepID=UPI000D68B61F|nr:pseudouridine synthase [Occallatibacter savannae]